MMMEGKTLVHRYQLGFLLELRAVVVETAFEHLYKLACHQMVVDHSPSSKVRELEWIANAYLALDRDDLRVESSNLRLRR